MHGVVHIPANVYLPQHLGGWVGCFGWMKMDFSSRVKRRYEVVEG